MARNQSRPGRHLAALGLILATLFGTIAAGAAWSHAQWAPKLGLDLEGGTQIVLSPVPVPGTTGTVDRNTLNQAVSIIRERVNGSGVTEAEVTTDGNQNIVVALPGKTIDEHTQQMIEQAAQMQFRAVLVAAAGSPQAAVTSTVNGTPTSSAPGTAGPTAPATPTASATATAGAKATVAASAPAATKSNGMVLPAGVRAALAPKAAATTPAAPSTTAPATTGSSPTATASPTPTATTVPAPTDASDTNWVMQQVPASVIATLPAAVKAKHTVNGKVVYTYGDQLTDLDCSALRPNELPSNPDKDVPFVTCDTSGYEKYVLGPAEVLGKDISSADATMQTNSQGNVTGEWIVQLKFDGTGAKAFGKVTTRLYPLTGDRNRFGIVLDGRVISAPTTKDRIIGGEAEISGNFTQQTASTLANQLKFGALPVTFQVERKETVSALLGREQLQRGLLAGVIGLVLVVLYSLMQYRALGFVTIFSLGIAGMVTYGMVDLLGWANGYRLSLPGVAGLIVSIGITADSFIVYFERVRDEVREGRSLGAAVEAGWKRAWRTIVISDSVSFLAALVLYFLAVGAVQGFAFTLGLTTLVDILVVFLFTKPTVTLLARTTFFGQGHPLSGFDPAHLGRDVTYAGRGRVRVAAQTIAERRAAAQAAAATAGEPSGAQREI